MSIVFEVETTDGMPIATAFAVITQLPDEGSAKLDGRVLVVGDSVLVSDLGRIVHKIPFVVKYRYQTERLFQPIPADYTPSQLGGAGYDWRGHGCTAGYVDNSSGWAWKNAGCDWIDANGVEQGSAYWAQASTTTTPAEYTLDVTAAINEAIDRGLWNAFLLKALKPTRIIAGARHDTPPVMDVVYEDGSTAQLSCIYSAKITTSTVYVSSTSLTHTLPAVIEFDRPQMKVVSATMKFSVTSSNGTTGTSVVAALLLNPPVNNDPVDYGLAENYGILDDGLASDPKILGVHRYLDGTTKLDFCSDCGLSITSEANYSPDIWNRGPKDTTKFPHLDLGKWIAAGDNHQLVDSSYTGEGFKPLAPGLGAMRVRMDATPGLGNGSIVDSTGTTASIARLFMPDEDFGLLKRLFVRYFFMFGTPLDTSFDKRFEVKRSLNGSPIWTDMAGKTGITPSHTNRWGFSGSSGGGYGWQMRLAWAIRNLEMGDPAGGAISLGLHTFDFGSNQPKQEYKYGTVDTGKDKMFGQRGGLGGIIWPGQWYCIEQEVDLNTVMYESPGYLPDGSVNVWVDGRPAFKRSGMVMRSLPLQPAEYVASSTRPARELGHAYLDFNWYHGGTTENPVDMTMFVTGLAWGKEYIGPMKLK